MTEDNMNTSLLATTARLLIAGAALTGAASATSFAAEAQLPAPVPFDAFMADLDGTPSAALMARPEARVASLANLEEMRAHLRKLYDGIDVRESYFLGGQTFDCVRYDQQPAVRVQGLTSIASPPSVSPDQVFHTAGVHADRNARVAKFEGVKCRAGTFPLPVRLAARVLRQGSRRRRSGGAGRRHRGADRGLAQILVRVPERHQLRQLRQRGGVRAVREHLGGRNFLAAAAMDRGLWNRRGPDG
jgi:hypothetical protein